MDRKEFCDLMACAKKTSKTTTSELSFGLRMLSPGLREFEKGMRNFNMVRALEYIEFIKYRIVISNAKKTITINKYEDLVSWQKKTRGNKLTLQQLSLLVKCSASLLGFVESQKTVMTIDIFLKVADALGYTIQILPHDE